jgi:hypothetical protein
MHHIVAAMALHDESMRCAKEEERRSWEHPLEYKVAKLRAAVNELRQEVVSERSQKEQLQVEFELYQKRERKQEHAEGHTTDPSDDERGRKHVRPSHEPGPAPLAS